MRQCKMCGEVKPLEEFQLSGKGYRRAECRVCRAKWLKEWRAERAKKPLSERYPTGTSTCVACGIEKPVSEFSPNMGGYLHSRCHACESALYHEQHANDYNRQFRISRNAEGLQVRKCRICQMVKPIDAFQLQVGRHRAACKDCESLARKERYAANPEKYRAEAREYGRTHREERSKRFKQWYGANRERNIARVIKWQNEHLEHRQAWIAANADRRRAADRRYCERHPERRRMIAHMRLSIIRATAGAYRMTKAEIIERDGTICYLCGVDFPPGLLTIEHVIPLSRGGGHTPDNLRVACGPCNCRKGAKLLD